MQVCAKKGLVAMGCVAFAGLGLVAAMGMGTPVASASAEEGGSAPTYAELTEMYPDEYNSAMTHKMDDEGEDNSHAGFQDLMETPAQRNTGGFILKVVDESDPDYTPVKLSCVSCKSSVFVDIAEEYGAKAAFNDLILDDDMKAIIDGRYCDCYSCHTWNDETQSLDLEANCAYANEGLMTTVATYMDENFGEEEILCGQCHNAVFDSGAVVDEETAAAYDPYRYGHDLEDMYKVYVEEGTYTTDEATGVLLVTCNHPQIEMFQDSVHQSMGLSCIDCHMPEMTDADGNTYRSHNSSGSVADNDDAMEFCLTCHSNQDGLETVDDMRAFLKDAQDDQLARQNEVQAQLDELYAAILDSCENGADDPDTLQQAKDDYSLAYYLVKEQQQNIGDAPDGAQIAHDPAQMRQMLNRASALAEDGLALLG